jgi:hypothetical protein
LATTLSSRLERLRKSTKTSVRTVCLAASFKLGTSRIRGRIANLCLVYFQQGPTHT